MEIPKGVDVKVVAAVDAANVAELSPPDWDFGISVFGLAVAVVNGLLVADLVLGTFFLLFVCGEKPFGAGHVFFTLFLFRRHVAFLAAPSSILLNSALDNCLSA
jgi:hypothetical protein